MHYIAMAAMTLRLSRGSTGFPSNRQDRNGRGSGHQHCPDHGSRGRHTDLLLLDGCRGSESFSTTCSNRRRRRSHCLLWRCVVRVNREFSEVFGYTAQEAIGRHIQELIEPEDTGDTFGRYAEPEPGPGSQTLDAETVRRRKDGSRRQAYVVGVPVHLAGGERVIYEMYMDITRSVRNRGRAADSFQQTACRAGE